MGISYFIVLGRFLLDRRRYLLLFEGHIDRISLLLFNGLKVLLGFLESIVRGIYRDDVAIYIGETDLEFWVNFSWTFWT